MKHLDRRRRYGMIEASFKKKRSVTSSHWKKTTHPSLTAVEQRSWVAVSDTVHSPSDRKIMTGALSCRNIEIY